MVKDTIGDFALRRLRHFHGLAAASHQRHFVLIGFKADALLRNQIAHTLEQNGVVDRMNNISSLVGLPRGSLKIEGRRPELAAIDNLSFAVSALYTGLALIVQGDPAAAAVPLTSFMDHVEGSDDPRWLGWGGAAASFLGDELAALRFYDRAVAAARALGAVSALPWLLENRALLEAASGRIPLAEADAAESVRLAEEIGGRAALVAMASLTMCAAFRGREEAARELGARTVAGAEQHAV